MPIMDLLLNDPIGQFSLFTVGFSIVIMIFLGIMFIKRSSKKGDKK